jgi:hypothetical protein
MMDADHMHLRILLCIEHPRFGLAQIMMHTLRHWPLRLVNDIPHPGQGNILALRDEHHLVAENGSQVANEVQILAGGILVDEKKFHGRRLYLKTPAQSKHLT